MQRSWKHVVSIEIPSDALRRPRGRPPNDSNGCPKNWDIESGCWRDASGAEHVVAKLESPVTPHEPIRKSVVFPRDGTIPEPVLRFADALSMPIEEWTTVSDFFSQPSGAQASDVEKHDSVVLRRTAAAEVVLFMSRGTGLWSLNVCPRV